MGMDLRPRLSPYKRLLILRDMPLNEIGLETRRGRASGQGQGHKGRMYYRESRPDSSRLTFRRYEDH